MITRRLCAGFLLMTVAGIGGLAAQSSATSVGLALPNGGTTSLSSPGWQTAFDWGFYVNIPLVSTFHITPSSELYKFDNQNATDVDLAFTFIVPLGAFDAYAGVAPGLTAVQDILAPHIGALGGVAIRLISNLDAFAQVKYTVLFEGGRNMGILHATAGVLFAF
jgi:hypothetical protein